MITYTTKEINYIKTQERDRGRKEVAIVASIIWLSGAIIVSFLF